MMLVDLSTDFKAWRICSGRDCVELVLELDVLNRVCVTSSRSDCVLCCIMCRRGFSNMACGGKYTGAEGCWGSGRTRSGVIGSS